MNAPLLRLLSIVTTAALVSLAAPVSAAPGDVKSSFDAPCKYPAGLATDGTRLFVLDWREAKIHAVAPADGKVLQSLDAPALKPHGLTYADGRLFVSDDHSGQVYVYNPETRMVERSFKAPGSRATGLAWAAGALFILERGSAKIYKVLPEDGTILNTFAAPNGTCTCLAFDGKYLWVSDRIKDEIYLVDPDTGIVLSILAAPGKYPAGLAWLDGHLWNVDFQSRKLYQLVVRAEQTYRLTEPREARVEYVWALYNYGPASVKDLQVNVAVPGPLPNQELLSDVQYSATPYAIADDSWGQACAVFKFDEVPAGTRQFVGYTVDVRVSAIRHLLFPDAAGTLADIPDEIREAYTVDGSHYRVDSPYIQKTVKQIVGDEQNPYWIARKIYNYVIEHLEYEMVGGWDVPEVVLQRGSGSCSEYTFAFIALCRAAGIPARYQGSVVVRGDDASIDEPHHRWAQIYLPHYGWIPVDANRGDAKSPADQARGFGELSNRFLVTTQGGGGSDYLGWEYNAHPTHEAGGYCKVEQETWGFWEPLTRSE